MQTWDTNKGTSETSTNFFETARRNILKRPRGHGQNNETSSKLRTVKKSEEIKTEVAGLGVSNIALRR